MSATIRILQTRGEEAIALRWSLHSGHSFLWVSSQHEAHCSTALTSWGGSTLLPHSASRLLAIPSIFGSERKGIPDDDSKASAAKGNSLHICFLCVCVYVCYECIDVYFTSSRVDICREFKMAMWLFTAVWNNGQCLYLLKKKWHPQWRCLSIYNLLFLAATTVKNALWWISFFSQLCPLYRSWRWTMEGVKKYTQHMVVAWQLRAESIC